MPVLADKNAVMEQIPTIDKAWRSLHILVLRGEVSVHEGA
jgi:hypothetical protein